MARLQILQLPEGASDDRPPFILIVDQYHPQRYVLGADQPVPVSEFDGIAERIGARTVLVFAETIDIPANSASVTVGDIEEHAGTTEIVYARERTRLALCDALLLSRDTTWRSLTGQAANKQREVAALHEERDALATRLQQVRQTPTEPELMNSEQERPDIWLHGYKCGVLAAKSATRPRDEETEKP